MDCGIRGFGVVSAAGVGIAALHRTLADPAFTPKIGLPRNDAPPLPVVTCHNFDPKGVLPPLVARRLDRASRLLAVACREALQSAGQLGPREQLGITVGTWTAGTSPSVEILKAVFTLGPDQAPPMQFPNSVANAPASQVAIFEGLAGTNLTFFEKQAGGLRAIVEGFRFIKAGKLQAVLAGGVDEACWLVAEALARLRALQSPRGSGLTLGEGAAVLLLAPVEASAGTVIISGAGAASYPCPSHLYPKEPTSLVIACQKALTEANLQAEDVDLVVSLANGSARLGHLEADAMTAVFGNHRPGVLGGLPERLGEGAFSSALRVVAAAQVLLGHLQPAWPVPEHLAQQGFGVPPEKPKTALVTAVAGGGSAVALVLQLQQG